MDKEDRGVVGDIEITGTKYLHLPVDVYDLARDKTEPTATIQTTPEIGKLLQRVMDLNDNQRAWIAAFVNGLEHEKHQQPYQRATQIDAPDTVMITDIDVSIDMAPEYCIDGMVRSSRAMKTASIRMEGIYQCNTID